MRIAIAHRLAVQSANRIIVIDEGQMIKMGTHAELAAQGKLYSRLAQLQFAAGAAE